MLEPIRLQWDAAGLRTDNPAAATDGQADESPASHARRKRNQTKREIRDLRRIESAAAAIEGLDRETELFGLTKGQFSLIDLVRASLTYTGPAFLTCSTWTAAHADLGQCETFLDEGLITGTRWLVDLSFQRRAPGIAHKLRQRFGHEAVRVARNHAKFVMLRNPEWDLLILTSMNLNMNPRYEDFIISHDPERCVFLDRVLDEIWARQTAAQSEGRPQDLKDFFTNAG